MRAHALVCSAAAREAIHSLSRRGRSGAGAIREPPRHHERPESPRDWAVGGEVAAGRTEASAVADLCRVSARFTRLWDSHAVGVRAAATKTIHHLDVGPIPLDCDVLTVPGSDLRVVAYTAAPGTEAASKLKLLAVIGTQTTEPAATA